MERFFFVGGGGATCDCQRTIMIRIAAINSVSNSAITIARFHLSKVYQCVCSVSVSVSQVCHVCMCCCLSALSLPCVLFALFNLYRFCLVCVLFALSVTLSHSLSLSLPFCHFLSLSVSFLFFPLSSIFRFLSLILLFFSLSLYIYSDLSIFVSFRSFSLSQSPAICSTVPCAFW